MFNRFHFWSCSFTWKGSEAISPNEAIPSCAQIAYLRFFFGFEPQSSMCCSTKFTNLTDSLIRGIIVYANRLGIALKWAAISLDDIFIL